MFGRYNQRAMYIPYIIYVLFSMALFVFREMSNMSVVFWCYVLLSNAFMTYITFKKRFSRYVHGYFMTFFMLIMLTLFSAKHHCIGSMQMIFFIIVCANSLYNSIGINLFEIAYITFLYLSYFVFAKSEIIITAGSIGWLYIRFAMLYIGFAIITLIIVIQKKTIKDAAERNEIARKATRVKSDFLANMSHEIRTPMNAVLGMVELALRCDMSEEAREYVRNIRSSGKNLLDIINDILDFSKIESGKMQVVEAEYEIMSLLNDVVNITHNPNNKNGLEFIVDADPTMPRCLFGDELRIKQAVLNFLSNAIKFTNSGSITIKMSYFKKDYGINLMVSVKDTGIGIREKDMAKLFNSFQQLDTHKNRRVEGTGLGLCVSKQLIELMGGFVNVKSVYGEGSEFSLIVPQNVIDKRPCVHIENVDEYNIAVFEENSEVRESIAKTLRDLGIEYYVCGNIDDLLTYISNNRFTHIFIEYNSYKINKERLSNVDDFKITALYNANEFIDHSENIRFLCKPIYHLSIAKTLCGELNNKRQGIFTESYQTKFIAPKAKILLVDDNAVNLRVAEGLLRPYNMKVQAVTSGFEAIKRIKEERFDIVFMDHMMPEMDGVETTKAIRALDDEYYKKLTIIALTANAISGAKEFFISEGMNDFISKPIEMRDMASKLKRWLPADKIITVDSINEMTENDISEKYSAAGKKVVSEFGDKDKFKLNDEIDFSQGIMNCGGNEEVYRSIAEVYISDTDEKAKLIRSYMESGDIKNYVVEVHALKSASRSIGAKALADLAESLEAAGKANNISEINNKTDSLIEKYFMVKDILSSFCKDSGSENSDTSDSSNSPDGSNISDGAADNTDSLLKETKIGDDVEIDDIESDLLNYDEENSDVEDSFLFEELESIISGTEKKHSLDAENVKNGGGEDIPNNIGGADAESDINIDLFNYDEENSDIEDSFLFDELKNIILETEKEHSLDAENVKNGGGEYITNNIGGADAESDISIDLFNYDEENSDIENDFLFDELKNIILETEKERSLNVENIKDRSAEDISDYSESVESEYDARDDDINADIDFDIKEYNADVYDGGDDTDNKNKDLSDNVEGTITDNSKSEVKNFPADDAWDYEYAFTPFEELETLEKKGFAGKAEKGAEYYRGVRFDTEVEKDILEKISLESKESDDAEELFSELNSLERMNGNSPLE